MTCIVGLVHDDGLIYMGADRAATSPGGSFQTIIADRKVFAVGDDQFVIGISGVPRLGQLMEHAFTPPPHDERVSVSQYMVTTFIDAMRRTLQGSGFTGHAPDGREVVAGSSLLIGYRGCLFVVEGHYNIQEAHDHFHAIGSGAQVARGALYATQGKVKDPFERLLQALLAAERFKTGVRQPFNLVCQQKGQKPIEVIEYSISSEKEYPRDYTGKLDSDASSTEAA
jgi:hypothetical protein